MTERTAVVTGAGSRRGIGRATAHALGAAGWHVVVLDLDADGAAATAEEVATAHGVRALGVTADLTDPASLAPALERIEAEMPPVGALVNNAGISSPTPFLEVTDEEWDRLFAVNVHGAYHVTRRIVPGMAERGFGRVVFLSSISAERGGGLFGAVGYSATKAALLGFTRALAREMGPAGITANAVAPGLVDTDIVKDLDDARRAELLLGVPAGRHGRVEDVADLITFLCREDAGYITGATYDVNGGSHIH